MENIIYEMHMRLLVFFAVLSAFVSANWFGVSKSIVFPRSRLIAKTNRIPQTHTHPFVLNKSYGQLSIHCQNGQVVSIKEDNKAVKIAVNQYSYSSLNTHSLGRVCEGIFGVYDLPGGAYLAIITQAEYIQHISMLGIKKIGRIELVKIPSVAMSENVLKVNNTELLDEQANAERILMATFKQHDLYFSASGYDITRTYQNNMLTPSTIGASGPYTRYNWTNMEEKFCWNLNHVKPFSEANCTHLIAPVVNAFIAGTNMSYKGRNFEFTLLSRRSRRRQGPRLAL